MEAGTVIGAYRVFSKIGEGGMGTVWNAEHTMLGRRAAIKILHRKYTVQPEIVTRFFNEARAAAAIADPGIVQIFDFGYHHDGSAYIAMELLEGEALDRRLHRLGRLPVIEALRILRQVAASVGIAHARGIIHRDLKPENIFLIRDPEVPSGERPKVLDFGIAKLTGDPSVRTDTSAVLGTPAFMSPEQCRGAGRVDQRTDIYSLGCVLFVLLTGRLPFEAEGAGELISMHLREPPPSPSYLVPGIPASIDALVLRCLSKDPQQRFASGAELAAELGHLVASPAALSTAIDAAPQHVSSLSQRAVALVTAERLPSAEQTTMMRRAGSTTLVARLTSSRWTWVGLGAFLFVAAGLTAYLSGDNMDPAAATVDEATAAAPPIAPTAQPKQPAMTTAIATTPTPTSAAPTEPAAPAAPVAPAAPISDEATPAAPASPSPTASPEDRLAFQMRDVLIAFVDWTKKNAGAPCPDIAALGLSNVFDPWGQPLRLTCTDQPDTQMAGARSAGPDQRFGSGDDVGSWQLAGVVTQAVQGARWQPSPLAPTAAASPAKTNKKQSSRKKRDIDASSGIPTER